MAAVRGATLLVNSSASGNSTPVQFLGGGRAALVASALTTFPTSVQLQLRGPDDVTWFNVGSPLTAAGFNSMDMPSGFYRVTVTGTPAGLYASLVTIPYV